MAQSLASMLRSKPAAACRDRRHTTTSCQPACTPRLQAARLLHGSRQGLGQVHKPLDASRVASAVSLGPTAGDGHAPKVQAWAGFTKEEIDGYLRMARLHNVVPALLMVLVGAWAGTGRDAAILCSMNVWAMAAISAAVSVASMVINDYFDWRSGADGVNAPDKPLPAGQVKPDGAVLVSGCLYMVVLIAACLMDHPALRAIVAFSAGATLLYTPVFKRMTMVKNALVASVIALAPLSGALAAGAATAMLQRLAAPSLFAFAAIVFREVLMDCTDEPGDRAAGVYTLPVMIGPHKALALATSIMLVGGIGALTSLVATTIAPVPLWQLPVPLPFILCGGAVTAALIQLVTLVGRLYASHFSKECLDHVVMDCLKPIGLAIIMLAAMV